MDESFRTHPAIIVSRQDLGSELGIAGSYTSKNWGGYVYCASNDILGNCNSPSSSAAVTGVSAYWTVPSYVNTSSSLETGATWVGIGGWIGMSDLVQDGLWAYAGGGGPAVYQMWWEMLPAYAVFVTLSPDSTISPGDLVYASTEYAGLNSSGYQEWTFVVGDATTNSHWQGTETCGSGCTASGFKTADWIQESPEEGTTIVQIPAFSTFSFGGTQFYTSGTGWTNFTDATPRGNVVYEQNSAYSSADLIVPSGLTRTPTFYVNYLVDAVDPFLSGTCCRLSNTTAEPNELVTAYQEIVSPDSFSDTEPTNLALEVRLFNGMEPVCNDTRDAANGFGVSSGTNSYSTGLRVCPLAYQLYGIGLTLWYVPLGNSIGSRGSLVLFDTGTTSPALKVTGPTIGAPEAFPASGLIDSGQSMEWTANFSGGTPPYTFNWSGLPSGCPPANASVISCVPEEAGNYSVVVRLHDIYGDVIESPTLNYTIDTDPAVLEVEATPASVDVGQVVNLTAIVAGGSGAYSFSWTGLPSGCSSADYVSISCVPSKAGNSSVTVSVIDSNGFFNVSRPLEYVVDTDPTLMGISASRATIDVGQTVTYRTVASGGSGTYAYSWSGLPAGCSSSDSANLTCTPSGFGTFLITVTVVDSNSWRVSSLPLSYDVESDPTATTPLAAPPSIDLGQSVTLTTSAAGGFGSYTYSWFGLPPGCSSSNSSSLACTPQDVGTYAISVGITDSNGFVNSSGTLTYTISVGPVISGIASSRVSVDLGQIVTFSVTARGGYGSYTYTWRGLPTGCSSLDLSNITCTPTDSGFFSIVVTVTDSNGRATNSTSLSFTVDPSISLTLGSSRDSADVGQTVLLSVNVTGGTGTYYYSWSGLPVGCSSANTSRIVCIPTSPGTYHVNGTTNDSNGEMRSGITDIEISAAPAVYSFSVFPNSSLLGSTVTLSVSAGGGKAPLSYSYFGLPSGCASVNHSSLVCKSSVAGTFLVHVVVTDANGFEIVSNTSFTVNRSFIGLPANEGYELFGAIVSVAVIIAVAGTILLQRRKKQRGSTAAVGIESREGPGQPPGAT